MKLPFTILVLFILFVPSILRADSSITITLINNTPHDLALSKYETRPKSRLSIDRHLLKAHESAVIIGTITADIDLIANVYFNEDAYRFSIKVHRLKKFGQPSLSMHGPNIRSRVARKTFNTDGNPTHLSYTAATVILD